MLHITEDTRPQGAWHPSRTFRWDGAPILDARTVQAAHGHLLVLTADGGLHVLDLQALTATMLCTVELPGIPPGNEDNSFGAPRHRLYASPDGTCAAIVVDWGVDGIVVDTRTGATTLQLNGGTYLEDTVPFSACFLRFNGRDVIVHRTDWNRLEASDAATGELLTERFIATCEAHDDRPEHYLDYFHGQLLPSPAGTLIFDDGWVWHPVSIPTVWSVTAWLTSNPWESEDGPSIVNLADREYWTQPACWIDERRIALWGSTYAEGSLEEEAHLGPVVRIVDVTLPGPEATHWWPLPGIEKPGALFSDGSRLYAATGAGTVVWDIASRERVAEYPGLVAQLLDAARNSLISFGGGTIQEIALPWPTEH